MPDRVERLDAQWVLDFAASVRVGMGRLQTDLARLVELSQPRLPLVRQLQAGITADGLTYDYIDLGTPNQGKEWDVKRYSISGADPFTIPAGVSAAAILSVTPFRNSNTAPTAYLGLIDPPAGIPNSAEWSQPRALVLRSRERVILVVKGASAGTQLLAAMEVDEYDTPGLPATPFIGSEARTKRRWWQL